MDKFFHHESDRLHITVSGEHSFHESCELVKEAFQRCIRKNLAKIFIDGRLLNGTPLTTLERYSLGEFIAEESRNFIKATGQIAKIVAVGTVPYIDPENFTEMVTKNRGGTFVSTCDYDFALKWLESWQ